MEAKISHDSETKAEGQQVITACAFIHKEESGVRKVFLAKRAATKKFLPDIYEMPGGHIEFGEDIVEGLKREVKEEFNVGVHITDPFFVYTYVNKIKGAQAIEVVYFSILAEPEENIRTNQEDHSTFGWFTEDELGTLGREINAADASMNHMIEGLPETDPELEAIRRGFEILRSNAYRI
jgi:8-oxo-dGTP pyrophosphatase MutT (NUDIX family)